MGVIEGSILTISILVVFSSIFTYLLRKWRKQPVGECACCAKKAKKAKNNLVNLYNQTYHKK